MKRVMTEMTKSITILAFTASLPLAAQWLNYPEQRTPRTQEGRPDLAAPAPHLEGKLDLSGVWQAERTPVSEFTRALGIDLVKEQVDLGDITKHVVNVFWGVKPEDEPLRPGGGVDPGAALANADGPPTQSLLPIGIPAVMFTYAFKVIQAPQEIVMLSETGDPSQQIYADGRTLPKDPEPSWMGYSVGRWEGDTLVVETTGFKERSWLDLLGHPRSQSMVITERYRRRDFGAHGFGDHL